MTHQKPFQIKRARNHQYMVYFLKEGVLQAWSSETYVRFHGGATRCIARLTSSLFDPKKYGGWSVAKTKPSKGAGYGKNNGYYWRFKGGNWKKMVRSEVYPTKEVAEKAMADYQAYIRSIYNPDTMNFMTMTDVQIDTAQ